MYIDSGASCNVIVRELWEDLKRQEIKCNSTQKTQNLFPYCSEDTLTVIGIFTARITVGHSTLDDIEFVVIKQNGQPYWEKSALQLGVLK